MWKSVDKNTGRDKDQTFADFYQSQHKKHSVNLNRAPFPEDDSYGYKQTPDLIKRSHKLIMSPDRLASQQLRP